MMSRFVEVKGWPWGARHTKKSDVVKVFYVLVNSIVKIVQLAGEKRLYVPLEDGETFDENNPEHVHNQYKYTESCEIVVGETDLDEGYAVRVLGKASDLVAQVEKCSIDLAVKTDKAIRFERTGLIELNDRGTWTADVQYARYDVVEHPSSKEQFLAVAPSKSPNVLILQNKSQWCRLG